LLRKRTSARPGEQLFDWLEAFEAHPKIGDLDALRINLQQLADCLAREQSGDEAAPDEVPRECQGQQAGGQMTDDGSNGGEKNASAVNS